MKFNQLPNIALVQMEVRAGRPDLNVARMLQHMDRAREAGAEIVAFSEMCIPGYIIGDLWEVDALVEDFAAYSQEIVSASEALTVLFGNVAIDRSRIGEDGRIRKYNAVHVCSGGQYLVRKGVPESPTISPRSNFLNCSKHSSPTWSRATYTCRRPLRSCN